MKSKRELEFDKNYSVLTFASAITFTIYFVAFIFLLNLTYLPINIEKNGFSGIFVLFSYYILTSLVLIPALIILNGLIGLSIKKIMKSIYIKQPLIGFIIYPAVMTIIPYFMTLAVKSMIGKVDNFDYYFIYITTWISTVIQYIWILKYMKDSPELLTEKQLEYLKRTDKVDYF